jgi:hypothetical protein
MQTAERPIGENRDHRGIGVFVFCKAALGGLIAILQNFGFQRITRVGAAHPSFVRIPFSGGFCQV